MSHQLISRSPDLTRLRDDGYEVSVVCGHVIVDHVPHLDRDGRVQFGTLVSTLTLDGDRTTRPDTHVAYFLGSEPCDRAGKPLTNVINSACPDKLLADGVGVDFMLSCKPQGGYGDYYAKMSTYVGLLMQHALSVDLEVTARTFPAIRAEDDGSPFEYVDTASSRARIAAISWRLRRMRIAIVGLGGTGSYILDLVAKCPVAEIHLYDGDVLLQHNAFRSPGAVGIDELLERRNKAEHCALVYRRLHRGVQAHPYPIDEHNGTELEGMDFVFVAVDDNAGRGAVAQLLARLKVPFVDVGIGMQARRTHPDGETLGGSVRTTLVDHDPARDHSTRVPTAVHGEGNEYEANIQIAELNALNAALAVIRWKRYVGIYDDLEHERHSIYDIDGNAITNDDHVLVHGAHDTT